MIVRYPTLQLRNISMSSTNSRWVSVKSSVIFIPFNLPLLFSSFIIWLSPSMIRRNKSCERGHPCHSPQAKIKNGDALPLTGTLNGMLVTHPIIHSIKLKGNPIRVKSIRNYNEFTLSNALDKSTFMIIPFHFLLWSECNTSCVVLIASWICLS